MEFSTSSSSDAELEEELHRNLHREQRTQRGIVRASSPATRCQAMRLAMGDGRSIEIRKGTIYIPSRDMYVHVLQARCCPEKWFGDGRVPIRRRHPLPPNLVVVQRVTEEARDAAAAGSGGAASRLLVDVTLSEATNNDFFVFKEVLSQKAENGPGRVAATPLATPSAGVLKLRSRCDHPLTDTQFQRITDLPRWRLSLAHPRLLREVRSDTWDAVELNPPLQTNDVCCYDDFLGILWKVNGVDGSLWYLRYDGNANTATRVAAIRSVCVATIAAASAQRCVGMHCKHEAPSPSSAVVCDHEAAHSGACSLLVVTASHVLIIRLAYPMCTRLTVNRALSTLTLKSVVLKPLHLASVACYCSGNAEKPLGAPGSSSPSDASFCVGAGRSVFAFIWGHEQWRKVRIASFSTTDVTALTLHSLPRHPSLPGAVAAGMRNGTIQVIAPEGRTRNRATFNTTPRHGGSDITSMFTVPGLAYGIVSVARDGGAKLWDLRRLGSDKEPVCTLLASRLGGGQSGPCSAAMAGHVLAVACVPTGTVCVDARTGTQLFHTAQNLSPATRIALGSLDGDDGFELYTFSPYFTQRFHLEL